MEPKLGRRTAVNLLGVALAACAAEPPRPAPPPFAGQPPEPPGALGEPAERPAPAPAPSATGAAAAAEAERSIVNDAPAEAAAPRPSIAVEAPFRLDQRVLPAGKEAFLADLRDRTRWNQGGMGTLTSTPPPVPGHPAPKVIVDVIRVAGPHPAADVQRILRKMFWIKVVGCYGRSAYKNQTLRGTVDLGFRITRAGKITAARTTRTTLNDAEVPACLAESLQRIELLAARAVSNATVAVQVGPGDEPMPPPKELIKPGDGILSPDAIRGVITAALPTFEASYTPALAYAPELWGRLGIRFHLTETGKLDEAFEVESRFPDERVTLCALRVARGLKFPKPSGGEMRFIVPLRLWSDRSPELREETP